MALNISLNFYSGRPNPVWKLGAEEGAEFLRLLSSLTAFTEKKLLPRLGYSGFTVWGDSESELPGIVDVYGGLVSISGRTLEDPGRTLESWLLGTAGKSLSPELEGLIHDELRRHPSD